MTKKNKLAILVASIMLIYSIAYLMTTKNYLSDNRTMILAGPMIFIVILLGLTCLFQEQKKSNVKINKQKGDNKGLINKNEIFMILLTFLYLILLPVIGFSLSSVIILAVSLFIFGNKKYKIVIVLPLIITFLLYFLMDYWLKIPLPTGIIF